MVARVFRSPPKPGSMSRMRASRARDADRIRVETSRREARSLGRIRSRAVSGHRSRDKIVTDRRPLGGASAPGIGAGSIIGNDPAGPRAPRQGIVRRTKNSGHPGARSSRWPIALGVDAGVAPDRFATGRYSRSLGCRISYRRPGVHVVWKCLSSISGGAGGPAGRAGWRATGRSGRAGRGC